MLTPRLALIWLFANLAGIGAFLLVASQYWVEPEIADIPGASIGNAFGWFFEAMPLFAVFVLANPVWMLFMIRGEPVSRWWRPLLLVVAMLGCWDAAYFFDNAHHGA
ncbi:MAG TPA: hypothetical protein VN029_09015 [Sphingomonas sp.]|nr:hypothetical protein [Sphingomonas sp.]